MLHLICVTLVYVRCRVQRVSKVIICLYRRGHLISSCFHVQDPTRTTTITTGMPGKGKMVSCLQAFTITFITSIFESQFVASLFLYGANINILLIFCVLRPCRKNVFVDYHCWCYLFSSKHWMLRKHWEKQLTIRISIACVLIARYSPFQ